MKSNSRIEYKFYNDERAIIKYMKKKVLQPAVILHKGLSEIISKHGIKRVRSGFYSYDLLYYIKPDLWFGFSYHSHCRDNWIEISIGELYQFDDHMPRICIIGKHEEQVKKLNTIGIINSEIPKTENAAKNINKTIDIIINIFDAVITNINAEVISQEKERLSSYLIKKLKTFDWSAPDF